MPANNARVLVIFAAAGEVPSPLARSLVLIYTHIASSTHSLQTRSMGIYFLFLPCFVPALRASISRIASFSAHTHTESTEAAAGHTGLLASPCAYTDTPQCVSLILWQHQSFIKICVAFIRCSVRTFTTLWNDDELKKWGCSSQHSLWCLITHSSVA